MPPPVLPPPPPVVGVVAGAAAASLPPLDDAASPARAKPPTIQTQAASVGIVLIGLILALMLLYRPAGILREKRIVSQEARLPDGAAAGRAASPGD